MFNENQMIKTISTSRPDILKLKEKIKEIESHPPRNYI